MLSDEGSRERSLGGPKEQSIRGTRRFLQTQQQKYLRGKESVKVLRVALYLRMCGI